MQSLDELVRFLRSWGESQELLSSLPGGLFGPALRPYMIGPVRNPDIQHLLEVFASLRRDLQCNKAKSSYSRQ